MMAPRAKILVITYTNFARAPRALKQVDFLKGGNDVTTAGFGAAPFENVPHVALPDLPRQRWGVFGRLLYLGLLVLRIHRPIDRLSALDRATVRLLGSGDWDIVIAHDLWSLAAALKLAPKRGVVLDLHEYAPSESEHSFVWRLVMAPYVDWMLRSMAPRVAMFVTVGEGIARKYREEFGFDSTVVVNATPFQDLEPGPVGMPLRLVHSGVAAVERRLDIMVDAVRSTSAAVTLDFFLVAGPAGQLEHLRELAGGDPRIRFRDPVPYADLVRTLNTYDVGLSIFPPTTFNLEWCLPNKFFDFIQARLGVIIGPSPEMARIVKEHEVGLVLPDFEAASLARALENLTLEVVFGWKSASAHRARELSSERQMETWVRIVAGLMSGDAPKGL